MVEIGAVCVMRHHHQHSAIYRFSHMHTWMAVNKIRTSHYNKNIFNLFLKIEDKEKVVQDVSINEIVRCLVWVRTRLLFLIIKQEFNELPRQRRTERFRAVLPCVASNTHRRLHLAWPICWLLTIKLHELSSAHKKSSSKPIIEIMNLSIFQYFRFLFQQIESVWFRTATQQRNLTGIRN